jgi:hypothetical protein
MRAAVWVAALLIATTGGDVNARGGGRGGGGFARGGGGFSRGGVAAGGSFGQGRVGSGRSRGQGPAASGSFAGRSDYYRGEQGEGATGDWQQRQDQRQQARQERRDQAREDWQSSDGNRREDWQDYADDHEGDRYYGDASDYPYGAAVVAGAAVGAAVATVPPYWTLDCVPNTVILGSTTYYQCGSAWYVRIYSGGNVAYTMVNPPAGY